MLLTIKSSIRKEPYNPRFFFSVVSKKWNKGLLYSFAFYRLISGPWAHLIYCYEHFIQLFIDRLQLFDLFFFINFYAFSNTLKRGCLITVRRCDHTSIGQLSIFFLNETLSSNVDHNSRIPVTLYDSIKSMLKWILLRYYSVARARVCNLQ